MDRLLKRLASRIFLCDTAQAINAAVSRLSQGWELRRWEEMGRTIPPPHIIKQRAVREYATRFSLSMLVETGTYLGTMIDATRDSFRHIFSVELDGALCRRARRRYARFGHITVLQGDSGEVLAQILAEVREPALFWLDAHHSGVLTAHGEQESPARREIDQILSHPIAEHVILADDAHAFTGEGGYPSLAELEVLIAERRPGWVYEVRDDIIRMHKRRAGLA